MTVGIYTVKFLMTFPAKRYSVFENKTLIRKIRIGIKMVRLQISTTVVVASLTREGVSLKHIVSPLNVFI